MFLTIRFLQRAESIHPMSVGDFFAHLIHLDVKSNDLRSDFPLESGGWICGLEEL